MMRNKSPSHVAMQHFRNPGSGSGRNPINGLESEDLAGKTTEFLLLVLLLLELSLGRRKRLVFMRIFSVEIVL